MAKEPTMLTVVDGYNQESIINENFRRLRDAWENLLSLDAETPNAMESTLDVADANITNTNLLNVKVLTTGADDVSTVRQTIAWLIDQLTFASGDIIRADATATLAPLNRGDNGEVLKVSGGLPEWGTDTDTDTVGITVQEDGVTVADNVTELDFKWPAGTIVTTPAGNQADVDLVSTIGWLWEDNNQDDTNLDPDDGGAPFDFTELDLTTLGISSVSANEYVVAGEGSSLIHSFGVPDGGSWGLKIEFLDSGLNILSPGIGDNVTGGAAGGNLLTNFQPVPANTRYIRWRWTLVALFPLNLTYAAFSNRFRGLAGFSQFGTIATPQGYTADNTAATITPGP